MPERMCLVTREICPCHPEADCGDCPIWHNRSTIQISNFQDATNKKLDEILENQREIINFVRRNS
jgi:hypothetical protein